MIVVYSCNLVVTLFISPFDSGILQAEQRSSRVPLQPEEERGRGVQEVEVNGQ